jgi:hypothetical protein
MEFLTVQIDAMIGEQPVGFPAHGSRVSDTEGRSRRPRTQSTLEISLKVQRHIESPFSELSSQLKEGRGGGKESPARFFSYGAEARKLDNFIEARMPEEDIRSSLLHDPRNVRLRVGQTQGFKGWQSHHHVADGGETDKGDALEGPADVGVHA